LEIKNPSFVIASGAEESALKFVIASGAEEAALKFVIASGAEEAALKFVIASGAKQSQLHNSIFLACPEGISRGSIFDIHHPSSVVWHLVSGIRQYEDLLRLSPGSPILKDREPDLQLAGK